MEGDRGTGGERERRRGDKTQSNVIHKINTQPKTMGFQYKRLEQCCPTHIAQSSKQYRSRTIGLIKAQQYSSIWWTMWGSTKIFKLVMINTATSCMYRQQHAGNQPLITIKIQKNHCHWNVCIIINYQSSSFLSVCQAGCSQKWGHMTCLIYLIACSRLILPISNCSAIVMYS